MNEAMKELAKLLVEATVKTGSESCSQAVISATRGIPENLRGEVSVTILAKTLQSVVLLSVIAGKDPLQLMAFTEEALKQIIKATEDIIESGNVKAGEIYGENVRDIR